MKGLRFFQEKNEKPVEIARLMMVGGGLEWSEGASEVAKAIVDDISTRASSVDDPENYLEELFRFIRNPYVWTAKVT